MLRLCRYHAAAGDVRIGLIEDESIVDLTEAGIVEHPPKDTASPRMPAPARSGVISMKVLRVTEVRLPCPGDPQVGPGPHSGGPGPGRVG